MNTGENEQGLRTITDFIRKASFIVLVLHFVITCYAAIGEYAKVPEIIQRILINIAQSPFFHNHLLSKSLALGLLALSVFGSKGKKDEKIKAVSIISFCVSGLLIYFFSDLVFYSSLSASLIAAGYITLTTIGYILFLTGAARFSRLIKVKLGNDIFNEDNETFPQEERLLTNEYSINLPGRYKLKGKYRSMWVNIINGARMVLIIGSPGAGKTYFLIRNIIKQKIENKQFPGMLVYDFKYDDLARIAYNSWLKAKHKYKIPPKFYFINFDEPINRCNPLEPSTMRDITDASESSRTILLGLNVQWIQKSGDFFVESPINFFTAVIWFLKKYKEGKYCTLPHAIELMQANYDDLFPVLSTEPEIEVLIG